MSPIRIQVGLGRLEYDADYGMDRRSGWSAVWDGVVRVQFVGLPRALWALWSAWTTATRCLTISSSTLRKGRS